jgi:hypothetical protein
MVLVVYPLAFPVAVVVLFPNLVELLALGLTLAEEVLLEVPLPIVPENGIGVKLVTALGKTWVQSTSVLISATPRIERRT